MSIDAQTEFSGTIEPQGADVLDAARLSRWMAAHVDGYAGPLSIRKFAGGPVETRPIGSTRPAAPMCSGASRSARCCPARTRWTANMR